MDQLSNDWVRPLEAAENYFLEVLLSRFQLTREGEGAMLELEFDESTPVIWGRRGVQHLREMMPDFKNKSAWLQSQLDDFLLLNRGTSYAFADPEFVFRYASGGTLPVLRLDGKDYYCLFYRDVSPVGWNIANGGCDSRDELRHPLEAAERELREELVVLDPVNRLRYVFAGEAGKPIDWPEFSVARRLWAERLGLRLRDLEERQIPLKWLDGNDRLVVRFGNRSPDITTGGFININALDFGIEIDRVARMAIDRDAVLCDGELSGDHLVNAPVALFEVDRFNRTLALASTEFIPDLLFHDGQAYGGNRLEEVLYEQFLPGIQPIRSASRIREFELAERKFDLCPVTRRIIARYLSLDPGTDAFANAGFRVFVSFGSEDKAYAQQVYNHLSEDTQVFFSEETIHQSAFAHAVEDALDQARCLIAVATKPQSLKRSWVQYELERFHTDILNKRKRKAELISYISGFEPVELPGPLRTRQSFTFDLAHPEDGLEKLTHFVRSFVS